MKSVFIAMECEILKARRSRLPLLSLAGFTLIPLVIGLFLIILKDPQAARSMGLINAKAQLLAGEANWSTLYSLLGQAISVGGILGFAILTSWVFGREFSDGTLKELLAVAVPRESIVVAKFIVIALWIGTLCLFITLLTFLVGYLVVIPGFTQQLWTDANLDLLVITLMMIGLTSPLAFAASAGKGYLSPMGVAIVLLILAQILAAAGWGSVFPWSIPPLFAGMAGPRQETLLPVSFLIVATTSVAGLVATLAWWRYSDLLPD